MICHNILRLDVSTALSFLIILALRGEVQKGNNAMVPSRFNILNSIFCCAALLTISAVSAWAADPLTRVCDRDGDGLGDVIGYDSIAGTIYTRKSKDLSFESRSLGKGAIPVLFDFNGDNKADLGTFNPTNAAWTVDVNGNVYDAFTFGSAGNLPVPGFYSHKDCSDFAVFERKTAKWSKMNCKGGQVSTKRVGAVGSLPVPADFDCDGFADYASFSRLNNEWTVLQSKDGKIRKFFFGLWGDIPLAADFNGDGCADAAVYRPLASQLFVRNRKSGASEAPIPWGLAGDIPVALNVDGNRAADFVVHRPSDNSFYITSRPDKLFFHVPFGNPADSPTGNLPYRRVWPVSQHDIQNTGARVPGSYDGDLTSDFAVLRYDSFDEPIWYIRTSSGRQAAFRFGGVKSVPVVGDYDGDSVADPVIISNADNGLLEWRLRDVNGYEKSAYFGLHGDNPLTGDFDCDKKNDFAVTRKLGGLHHWFIRLSTGGEVGPLPFGLEADKTFGADMNGDGCDDVVVAQEVFGAVYWYSITLSSLKAGGKPRAVSWGLAGDQKLAPMDMDGDGLDDYIVVRPIGGALHFFIYFTGKKYGAGFPFGLDGDIPMTGYFSGLNQAEIAVYRRGNGNQPSSFFVRQPHGLGYQVVHGSGLDTVIKPDGRKPEGSGENVCTVVKDFFDGQGGALWKAVSENTGNPVMLLDSEYWYSSKSIQIFGRDGQYILSAKRRNCCPNGGRGHWDIPMSGGRLEAYAPIQVRLSLTNGATECRTVYHPSRRED
jgi:hypothetical protein